jgi:hypothetical protein
MISGWRWTKEVLILSSSISGVHENMHVNISDERSISRVLIMMSVDRGKKPESSENFRNSRRISESSFTAILTTVCSRNMSDSSSQKKRSTSMNSISDGMNGEMNGISGMENEPQNR